MKLLVRRKSSTLGWTQVTLNLFVSGYLSDMDNFDKSFPTAIRPQGKEIVRTWLYYTLLKSALLLDKPGFKHVWIDGLVWTLGAERCQSH